MLPELGKYIEREKLFNPTDRLVLAVSGGVDSMVMLDLFRQLPYDFVVAHCNFKLRGTESDGDEVFMRDYCGEHGIELYVKTFDTREFALQEGISIEMAARELRYKWFYELLDSLHYQYLLTAHHQDDLVETMLINLSRGTGIRGLSGIHPKKERRVRPLLFAAQQQIVDYAAAHQISYRDDATNDDTIYHRNLIRHEVIPLLEKVNSAFKRNAAKTANVLRETERIYQSKIEDEKQQLITRDRASLYLSIGYLKQSSFAETLLFEVLHPYGFNNDQTREIHLALDAEAGKSFYSDTHRLVKDREQLILSPLEEEGLSRYYIEADCLEIDEPVRMQFLQLAKDGQFSFSKNPQIADVDLDKLQFPLVLKKWEQGEYFQPLGMDGFKKLSDFFIDEKFSIPEKESCWILFSSGKVVWITGHRIDNRFKITAETKRVLRVTISE
ncbi:MAG TPA: tRNA lysidine(34) synthetase TilS [Sunxiuqinia sp.]|nr:tRNA lysidine(34) synthetase TilS [Sunxiuqinia sp.]